VSLGRCLNHREHKPLESFEIRQVYAAARELRGESALLDELVASSPSTDPQQTRGDGDTVTVSKERLRAALAVLEEKATPEDVDAYTESAPTLGSDHARARQQRRLRDD